MKELQAALQASLSWCK